MSIGDMISGEVRQFNHEEYQMFNSPINNNVYNAYPSTNVIKLSSNTFIEYNGTTIDLSDIVKDYLNRQQLRTDIEIEIFG